MLREQANVLRSFAAHSRPSPTQGARSHPMTIAEALREQARGLRTLAANPHAQHLKDLLIHLAEECDRLAERAENDFADNGP